MADDGNFDNDDEDLVESMGKLQEMQGELAKIEEEERSKIMKLKRKYNEFRRELYDRRNHIIQSISGFWVSAFLNHPAIAGKLSEEDEKVFKYMVSLEVEDFNDEDSGYSITFNFSPNPFFEGTKLTRSYFLSDHGITNVTSTTIKWKDSKENKGIKRRITDHSFFKWFDEEPRILTKDVIDVMARVIKEELWIDPLNYFKNEADVDVNADGIDDDNDHDDKEDDDENFNGSDGNGADNKHNDEGEVKDDKNDCDSFEQDEIKEQYDVEPDDEEEIEGQNDVEVIEEQNDDEEEEEAGEPDNEEEIEGQNDVEVTEEQNDDEEEEAGEVDDD
ncbi:hypothetical protein M5K25_012081 [Dendrobium thyrsiflorum]|uniref:Template-activating factor I n=1 Tax=Dendrobium thyrsiflorum TaxID=117978 RepID=A0ABD0UWM3_DENTH